MRQIIIISFLLLLFISCKTSYIQLIDTGSTNTKKEKEYFVFENDSLKISYNFWARNGLMAFTVYNKLNKPLYIDWKKSSYIDNSVKLNYWVDGEITKTKEYYGSYYYYGQIAGTASSTTMSVERITFIPPKSKYPRSQFYILPNNYVKMNPDADFKQVPLNNKPPKTTKVYERFYEKYYSPLVFRNFLTFSYSEDFKNEFYVDNEFYISKINEMDSKHFYYYKSVDKVDSRFLVRDLKDSSFKFTPFRKGSSFYKFIPKEGSIEYRKKRL